MCLLLVLIYHIYIAQGKIGTGKGESGRLPECACRVFTISILGLPTYLDTAGGTFSPGGGATSRSL